MLTAPVPSVRNGFWRLVALTILAALAAYPLFGALLDRVVREAPTQLPLRAYTVLPTAKEFVADDAGFRAVFPATPKRVRQEIRVAGGSTDLTMFVSETAAMRIAAGSSAVRGNGPSDLYAGMNGAVDTVKGHLESSELVTFAGFPGIEFAFTGDDYFGRGMIVHAPERTYVVFVLNRHGSESADYDAFKDSFVITP